MQFYSVLQSSHCMWMEMWLLFPHLLLYSGASSLPACFWAYGQKAKEDSRSGIPGKCLTLVSRKQGSKTSCFFLALIYHGSRDSWQEVSNANALALGIWLVVFMLTRTSENRLHCWWKSEELVLLSCLSVGSSLPAHPPPKDPMLLCRLSLFSLSSQSSEVQSPHAFLLSELSDFQAEQPVLPVPHCSPTQRWAKRRQP